MIFQSNVQKTHPHVGTMFNFVETYRFAVSPLTISENFILITFFVEKVLAKTFPHPLGGPGLS